MSDARVIHPHNHGWLEKKLSTHEMDYLWKCIDKRKDSVKSTLAGNIYESNKIVDEEDWFFKNTLLPLIYQYGKDMGNIGDNIPVNQLHPYFLRQFWVNYQKQNEFNPLHDHNGVYSFVVWMKIPTRHFEQNKNPISMHSNTPVVSAFEFRYINTLGRICNFVYEMNPEIEGTMLFFPSRLQHEVHPFFNCDEDRISISGNIAINTKESL